MALRVVAPGLGARRPAGGAPIRCRRPRITEARQQGAGRAGRNSEPRGTGELARAAGVGAGVRARHGGCRAAGAGRAAGRAAVRDPRPGASTARSCRRTRQRPPRRCAQAVAARAFSVTLLDGVTGSGKTEVYLEAVAECLRQGRQALVLLPEIALSSQWLERFERRFGVAPAVWHSDLTSRVRRDHLARGGRGRGAGGGGRALGAVPAVPRSRPGRGRRGARDRVQAGGGRGLPRPRHGGGAGAVLRGAGGAGVRHAVSLETVANVEAGRYRRITLPTRHGGAVLPAVAPIDMRGDAAGARAFPRAAADRGGARHAGARRAGDAVPQPPRLCAADAVPALRPSHAVPELHRLAGGAPRAPRAAMPPLRPHRADPATSARPAARRTAWCRSGQGWSASPRRPRRCFPRRAGW